MVLFVAVVLASPQDVVQSQVDKQTGGGLFGAALGGFLNAIVDSEETTGAVADRAKEEIKKELAHSEIGAHVDVCFEADAIFVLRLVITDIKAKGLVPQCGPMGWGIFNLCLTQCRAHKPLRQTVLFSVISRTQARDNQIFCFRLNRCYQIDES